MSLGTHISGATKITDHDMYLSAKALESQVTEEELTVGSLYPPLHTGWDVSAHIASTVAENAYATGVATNSKPNDLLLYCKSVLYDPFEN